MQKGKPMTFAELSTERQDRLVAHFTHEFNLSPAEARNACVHLAGEDLEIHLEAAEHGYI